MPVTTIHLLVADKVKPNGSALFYVGNCAPDAVPDYRVKDKLHFRNQDRQTALANLAKETVGEFAEGMLLHLFVDWKWDSNLLGKYIAETDENWFASYRVEKDHLASYYYHNMAQMRQVFDNMMAVDSDSYGTTPGASATDIKNFIERNHKWHCENVLGASQAFPPDVVEHFVTQTAQEYIAWRIRCREQIASRS